MIGPPPPDSGYTGLELVIVMMVLCSAVVLMGVYLAGGSTVTLVRTFPGGIVAESMYMSGDGIQPVGSLYGFSAAPGNQPRIPILYRHPAPDELGSVQLTVSLFMGDTGAIDTDHLNVTWSTGGTGYLINKTRQVPLICPNWTITGKYNMLPGRTADSDEWLEPGEQFQILVCPDAGLSPGQVFTLGMYPEGIVVPLRATRVTPPRIRPIMNLG